MQEWFKEAADPSRRKILAEMRFGPKSVNEIVAATGMRQPNVSNHLARLRERGLVRADRSGRKIFYSLSGADVRRLLAALLEPEAEGPPIEEVTPDLVASFARQAVQADEAACTATVDAVLRGSDGLLRCYADLFGPALVMLGEWWMVKAVNEAEEHLASAQIERLMTRCMHRIPPAPDGARRAVLGCSPGNRHSIALRMVSDLMAAAGWKCFFLGADVPSEAFRSAVRAHEPDAVLVSCLLDVNVPEALDLLARLREDHADPARPELLAGGRALAANADELDRLQVQAITGGLRELIAAKPDIFAAGPA